MLPTPRSSPNCQSLNSPNPYTLLLSHLCSLASLMRNEFCDHAPWTTTVGNGNINAEVKEIIVPVPSIAADRVVRVVSHRTASLHHPLPSLVSAHSAAGKRLRRRRGPPPATDHGLFIL